jgi:hypothetical protein
VLGFNLVLKREQIALPRIIAFCPEVPAILELHELDADPKRLLRSANAAFQQIIDTKSPADAGIIQTCCIYNKGGLRRNDSERWKSGGLCN